MKENFTTLTENLSIIDVLSKLDYKHDTKGGRKFPRFIHNSGDKVCIMNPERKDAGYFNQSNPTDKGSLYQFIESRMQMGIIKQTEADTYKSIMNFVREVTGNISTLDIPKFEKIEESKEFIFDKETDLTELKNRAYLYSRGINDEVLDSQLFKNRLFNPSSMTNVYQTNIAVPLYNENQDIVGLEYLNLGFKQKVKNSERASSVWHGNFPKKIDNIVVTENVIDAMSHYMLSKSENTLYVSTQGALSQGQIDRIKLLKELHCPNATKIKLAFDNDKAGRLFDLAFLKDSLKGILDIEYKYNEQEEKVYMQIKGSEHLLEDLANPLGYESNKIETLAPELSHIQRIEQNKRECKVNLSFPIKTTDYVLEKLSKALSLGLCTEKSKNKDFNDDLKQTRKKKLIKR